MSKPLRIEWLALLDRLEAAGLQPGSPCLVCLPEAGKQLLLAIADRLQWKATYRVDGYDYSDWDDMQTIVEDTIGALAVADCTSIVNQIATEVTNSITQMQQTVMNYQDACCYLETNPVNTPPPSEEPPPATGGERDNLCIQAQIAHDGGYEFLEQVFLYLEGGGGLTAAVIAALLGPLSLPLVLISALVGLIVTLFTDTETDDILDLWDAIKHDVVCAIVNSVSAEDAQVAVYEVIDDTDAPGLVVELFKTMYSQAAINQIWEGTFDDPGTYTASYCADCAEWVNVGGIAMDILSEDGNKYSVVGSVNSGGGWTAANIVTQNPTTPHTLCFVRADLTDYAIGDQNVQGSFDDTPIQPWVGMGCQSGNAGAGFQSVTFNNFKILVSTAENPGLWVWMPATVELAIGEPEIPGEFEVDEGPGDTAEVRFISIPFNGNAEQYKKNVAITTP